ncbi:FYVE, RhoGEF and PH domain-containing protein 5 [Liparis tanakae]|uniref:FYVE, RhoGEF and PH domain-containing protein 5 n=1 Tax=Liparis tanakae TaxID=230148 RepID=A0A4Z2G8D9_9TELE|nr:FYVE, RhoGEF and PH domain-containing protein 5 [Liparis tanakae]
MLYTYPQQDGKYRLKNTLSLSGMKVSKPVLDHVLNCLKIEVSDITITLSASSVGEREDWFHTLSRAVADHAAGLCTFGGPCSEAREKLWMALGEAAPVLVPVSHAMMCMNCTSDFSLTLRRHHCNACGKDKVASESLPLQCFTVKLTERPEGEESNVFHLYHKKTLHYTFRADDPHTARRWVNAMEEATVL